MNCMACGRRLRNIASQEAGYGPVCYRRLFGGNLKRPRRARDNPEESMVDIQIPGQMELSDFIEYPAI